ncbi:hypothetical protein NADE_003029 [Nannochloris sp. 'desiccata']|nr:hypothetical protein KSW81_000914 [Chlorella desiccata (nom. nud.)]KAH7620406.1 hypothetical protein NADE_003029 [Chlorella desiccata (nom. nud.)]
MSTSLFDGTCDAHAHIVLAPISSPIKGLSFVSENKVGVSNDAGISQPPVEDSASLSPLKPSSSIDIPNGALIHKLLESLEALKTQDSRTNSGTASPSPLTISTGGSADPIPSSPTDIYDFSSPVGPLTREHSTDSLAAAVQHLSLAHHRRPAAQSTTTHHPANLALSGFANPINTATTHASSSTWSAPVTTAGTPTNCGPPTPLQMPSFQQVPQTQQAQQAGLFSTSAPTAATRGGLTIGASLNSAHAYANNTSAHHSNLTFPVAAATGAGAVGAPQLAAYQSLYTDQMARSQAQMQLFRMLSPPPTPVYEECLVGIDGAYQSYCRQVINNEINVAALRMLAHVKAAQLTDSPAISRLIGKRYFCSLKEVSKVVGASRMLLIAPDVRPSITAHIKPVRLLQMVMAAADAAGVPYVFCLSRRGIGQVFGRDKSMSIVAVMHVDGVENEYVTLLEQGAQGRELYAAHRGGQNNNHNNGGRYNHNMNAAALGGAHVCPLGSVGGGYQNPEFNYNGQQYQPRQQQQQQFASSYLNPQPQFPLYHSNNNQHSGYQGSY